MNVYLAGLLAGCMATLPMTLFMMLLFRALPRREQYPLPPRQVTMEVAEKAGIKERLDEPERTKLTLAAHFGYGTVTGFLYSLFTKKVPGDPLMKGVLFGLLVWAGSYLLLLPALGILRSATHHPLVILLTVLAAISFATGGGRRMAALLATGFGAGQHPGRQPQIS